MRYKEIKEGSLDGYYLYKDAEELWLKDNPGKTGRDFERVGVAVQDEYTEKAGGIKGSYRGAGVSNWTRKPKESTNPSLEALVKHIKEGVPLCDSIFRHHSESYLDTFKHAKQLREQGVLPELDWESEEMLTLDIGESATLMNGETVWLDVPYMIESEAPDLSDGMIGVPDAYYDEEERKEAYNDYKEFTDRYDEDEYFSIADGFCPACGGNGYQDGDEYDDDGEENTECDGSFTHGCDEGEIENASWVEIIKHDKRNAERQKAKANYPGDEAVIKQVAAYMKHMDDPRLAYQQMAVDYPHMGRAERSGLLAKAKQIAFPEVAEMRKLAGLPLMEGGEPSIIEDALVDYLVNHFSSFEYNYDTHDELDSSITSTIDAAGLDDLEKDGTPLDKYVHGGQPIRDYCSKPRDVVSYNEVIDKVKAELDLEHIKEAEYRGKKVQLSKPKRGGSKKFYVYVKDPKSGNIKKVSFGADSGGGKLAVKLKDPKARKAFADRHNCDQKKDKTKAGYWSCRLPRYAKSLGLSGGGTWW